MKKINFLIIGIILIFSIILSCRKGYFCESGYGEQSSQEIKVNEFNRINLTANADVYLSQGDTQEVSIVAQDNILKILKTNVIDQEMVIDFDECVSDYDKVKIYIKIKNIKALKVSGAGTIISEDNLISDNISLTIEGSGNIDLEKVNFEKIISLISGSGDINLIGTNNQHVIQISGTGNINAFDLISHNVNVELSGSGNIHVFVNNTLNVKISGSGSVYYKGNPPNINMETTGTGKVISSN